MKLFLWITFLALAAETYAATVVPASLSRARLLQRDETSSLKKAGKTIESVGKILQGQASLLTAEELDTTLHALVDQDSEEYGIIVPIIAAIVGGAASGAVGAGVSHALNKG